ncbi:hypothetical protein B0H19DRAFT_1186291 [Mycena capillaripes]|nr:hypothetical protein B0H19DRAFT_1186291 [Mycena capillaripes]
MLPLNIVAFPAVAPALPFLFPSPLISSPPRALAHARPQINTWSCIHCLTFILSGDVGALSFSQLPLSNPSVFAIDVPVITRLSRSSFLLL